MTSLKLTYELIEESPGNFTGWINEVEGVIAQGKTVQEVREELLKILRIKWEVERRERKTKPETCNTKTEELNLQIAI
ncbi:MAG: hypothetical protein ABI855_06995 [Bacteroidota bacterium]